MIRPKPKTHLTEFDLMVIRAGGHTQAELEEWALNRSNFSCAICAYLADGLYRIVMCLEAGANRSVERSHHRFIANAAN